MKVLDKQAEAIFRQLLELLGRKEHLKLDNSGGVLCLYLFKDWIKIEYL